MLDYSRRRLQAAIGEVEPGVYEGTEVMDDDGHGNGPFHLTARVTIGSDHVEVDLTDASPQAEGPINCSWGVVKAGVYTALKAVLDPDMPLDAAITGLVTIVAQEGTWVRPTYPAPTFGGPAEPSNRVCEAVLAALGKAVPACSMAYSYASGINLTGSGVDPRNGIEFVFYQFGPGGCGARSHADGNSAAWHPMCSCRIESIELWERRYPVRFTHFALRPDSGGEGQYPRRPRLREGVRDPRDHAPERFPGSTRERGPGDLRRWPGGDQPLPLSPRGEVGGRGRALRQP